MGKRTSYSPGTFSWVDLGTTDAAAAKSFYSSLFGWVIEEAFDVLDVGRTAVIEDPQGAVLALWQPGTRIGAERVNDVGCLCMNELATTDMRAAGAFYERLFGWTVEISDDAPEGPAMIFNGGDVNGALFAAPEGAAPHWRPCFTVESTDDALERVRELGGPQLGEPLDVGHGSIGMVLDPQGALFTIFAGEVDP